MRFCEFIKENLAAELENEPKSKAAEQAKRLGVKYIGFGRYADDKGEVKYLSVRGKLVPFKGRESIEAEKVTAELMPKQPKIKPKVKPKGGSKGNKKEEDTEVADRSNKINDLNILGHEAIDKRLEKYITNVKAKVAKTDEKLRQYFQFDDETLHPEEKDALYHYTDKYYDAINKYLYQGFDEKEVKNATYLADLPEKIEAIDGILEDSHAPFDYTTYVGLSSRYSHTNLQKNESYLFRGYLSSTLDHNVAVGSFSELSGSKPAVLLQVDVKKGQNALYLAPISEHPAEYETLLPRGTSIKVMSGPHIIDAGTLWPSLNANDGESLNSMKKNKIAVFKCIIE